MNPSDPKPTDGTTNPDEWPTWPPGFDAADSIPRYRVAALIIELAGQHGLDLAEIGNRAYSALAANALRIALGHALTPNAQRPEARRLINRTEHHHRHTTPPR